MLRHKMDTKQQGEHTEHKPKKQPKYKKHYCFPRMFKKSKKCLIAASAGEKSQQRQKAKLFLGTTMLIACTKMNPLPPPDARLDVEDDEETDQDGLSVAVLEDRYLRQVVVESW